MIPAASARLPASATVLVAARDILRLRRLLLGACGTVIESGPPSNGVVLLNAIGPFTVPRIWS